MTRFSPALFPIPIHTATRPVAYITDRVLLYIIVIYETSLDVKKHGIKKQNKPLALIGNHNLTKICGCV